MNITSETQSISIQDSTGRRVELPFYEAVRQRFESGECALVAVDSVWLEPFTQRTLSVQTTPLLPGTVDAWVQTSETGAEAGIVTGRGITELREGRTKILVSNFSTRAVRIAPGQSVASVGTVFSERVHQTVDDQMENATTPVGWKDGLPAELDLSSAEERLTRRELSALKRMLKRCSGVWRRPDEKLGADVPFRYHLETTTEKPINQGPRRLHPTRMMQAQTEVDRMRDLDVIEASRSPWASPIVLIEKKDGGIRFCVDYRKLNEITVSDAYPLPRCDDLLGSLAGCSFFTALDMEAGYWQIPMSEESKSKTAFVTPFGAWQFKVLPFGLKNAPAVFQRTMDAVLAGVKWVNCLVYIDDVLIYSKSFEEHLKAIEEVFSRLVQHNFKLKPSKCDVLKPELLFLGHLISAQGLKPNPKKVDAVERCPTPATVKEVESFLGLTGYFRKFVKDYALIAKPLYGLKAEFTWNADCQQAFETLKLALCNPPLLAHPVATAPFILETDACDIGLGAVLLQIGEDGREHPVEYASRLIRVHERNWPVREKEALAILWGCEHFEVWLLQQPFIVRTDHLSLQWLHKAVGGRLERWAMRLQKFTYKVVAKRGKHNAAADFLSRSGLDVAPEHTHSDEFTSEMVLATRTCTMHKLREAQMDDRPLREMIVYLMTQRVPAISKSKIRRFQATAKEYKVDRSILRRNGKIVVPQSLRTEILTEVHEGTMAAHLSADKILPIIAERFWWPAMKADTRRYCEACLLCNRATPYASKRFGKLRPIVATGPWHTVAMDLYGPLNDGIEDERYVLVMMDHFTKYVVLCALKDKRAATVARKVRKYLLCQFGVPKRIITDNGTEFKGQFDELCEDVGIQHSMSLPYHQQANGLVERYMQLLNKMVKIVAHVAEAVWPRRLCTLAFAYNTSYHPTVQNTPFFLNFLRDPRLPLDNFLREGESDSRGSKVKDRFQMSKDLIDWTCRRIAEVQQVAAVRYDERQRDFPCSPGDLVFVREETHKSKSDMKWSELHRVQSMDDNKLNVVVTSLYGPDPKPITVNVQRLRPYHESELNLQGQPEAPVSNREKVPSPEPDPEDDDLVEAEAYQRFILAASTVANLGKEAQLEDDRQWTRPAVPASRVLRETGGAAELPETLEESGNLHRPASEGESLSNDLLPTSESSSEPQIQETVGVGERPHQEVIMDQIPEPVAEAVEISTVPAGERLIESLQPELPVNEALGTTEMPSEAVPPVSEPEPQSALAHQEIVQETPLSEDATSGEAMDPSIYTVQDILGHRKKRLMPGRRYKVLWEGYPVESATWQEEKDFTNEAGRRMLEEYKQRKKLDHYAFIPPGRNERDPRRHRPTEVAPLSPPPGTSARRGRKSTRTVVPDSP